jgi:hypothetical protein
LQHRRNPPICIRRALLADAASSDDLLYVPLEIVPIAHKDDFEMRWTLRANGGGACSLNAFNTKGNPAKTRRFWQRRHVLQMEALVRTAQNVAPQKDAVIDLT